MAIKKNSKEWLMMRDLYALYEAYLDTDIVLNQNQMMMADKITSFQHKHKDVPVAFDFSEAIASDILRRLKNV